MANLGVNNVVLTIIAISIGLILCGSLLAPIANEVMTDLTSEVGGVPVYESGATWASLIGVTVVISILGLIIVAVNNYTKK